MFTGIGTEFIQYLRILGNHIHPGSPGDQSHIIGCLPAFRHLNAIELLDDSGHFLDCVIFSEISERMSAFCGYPDSVPFWADRAVYNFVKFTVKCTEIPDSFSVTPADCFNSFQISKSLFSRIAYQQHARRSVLLLLLSESFLFLFPFPVSDLTCNIFCRHQKTNHTGCIISDSRTIDFPVTFC